MQTKSQKARQYYKDLDRVQKSIWLQPETVYRLELLAARKSLDKRTRVSFTTLVNELLDQAVRDLPDK